MTLYIGVYCLCRCDACTVYVYYTHKIRGFSLCVILVWLYNIKWCGLTDAERRSPQFRRRHFEMHFNEHVWISLKISLKFVPKVRINIPALVQIMAWCQPDDKPLSESMIFSLPTNICVARPQWVNVVHLPIIVMVYSLTHGQSYSHSVS